MAKINDRARLVRTSMSVECLQCYLQLQRVALHFSVHGPPQTSLQSGSLCREANSLGSAAFSKKTATNNMPWMCNILFHHLSYAKYIKLGTLEIKTACGWQRSQNAVMPSDDIGKMRSDFQINSLSRKTLFVCFCSSLLDIQIKLIKPFLLEFVFLLDNCRNP